MYYKIIFFIFIIIIKITLPSIATAQSCKTIQKTKPNALILNKDLCFYSQFNNKKVSMYMVQNNNIPYVIRMSFSGKNLVLPPNNILIKENWYKTHKAVASFAIDNPYEESSFSYSITYIPGRLGPNYNTNYVYHLPYASNKSYQVSQAYSSTTHNGHYQYAVDFAMKINTPIHAARSGLVIDTEERFDNNGAHKKDLMDKANFVKILHDDGSVATYAHLNTNGVYVEIGQQVFEKQLIGYSGNSGYSSGPHLHFHILVVRKNYNNNIFSDSVPSKFYHCNAQGKITTYNGVFLQTYKRYRAC